MTAKVSLKNVHVPFQLVRFFYSREKTVDKSVGSTQHIITETCYCTAGNVSVIYWSKALRLQVGDYADLKSG